MFRRLTLVKKSSYGKPLELIKYSNWHFNTRSQCCKYELLWEAAFRSFYSPLKCNVLGSKDRWNRLHSQQHQHRYCLLQRNMAERDCPGRSNQNQRIPVIKTGPKKQGSRRGLFVRQKLHLVQDTARSSQCQSRSTMGRIETKPSATRLLQYYCCRNLSSSRRG